MHICIYTFTYIIINIQLHIHVLYIDSFGVDDDKTILENYFIFSFFNLIILMSFHRDFDVVLLPL